MKKDNMNSFTPSSSAAIFAIVVPGLIALALAMGVGRFAFTPILPMMQADAGLSLAAAGWLAAANYLGYLLGALAAARLSLAYAVRGGMLLIALVTFAMGVTHGFALQLALRLLAGIASAGILVHVSAWALSRLAVLSRPAASGLVFAGIGVGIAGEGIVCMVMMQWNAHADRVWQVLGVVTLVLLLPIWPAFSTQPVDPDKTAQAAVHRVQWNSEKRRLLLCYAAFGFGYIIPATFLPAMAHQYINNPIVFGWAWPVFGAAAALSTYAVTHWLQAANTRKLWAISYVLMALGVVLPVLWPSLAAILIAALLVGGTFMVATMLGLSEARQVASIDATAFIAAMTAAFAATQILGPLVVSGVSELTFGFEAALVSAAFMLIWAAIVLWRSAR